MPLLVLLFVAMPILELWLLLRIGGAIGAGPTVGIVLTTGILGGWLARREGLKTMRAFTAEANAGRLPGRPMVDGLLIFAGGALLMTPGVVTDALGLGLLLPPTRALVRRALLAWVRKRIAAGQIVWYGPASSHGGPSEYRPPDPSERIVDATLEKPDDDEPRHDSDHDQPGRSS